MISSIWVAQVKIQVWVVEVNVTQLRLACLVSCSVWANASCEFLELHNVTCQCSGLVGEHILHLTQLFVEIGRLRSHLHVLQVVIHRVVVRHKDSLPELYQLERYHK